MIGFANAMVGLRKIWSQFFNFKSKAIGWLLYQSVSSRFHVLLDIQDMNSEIFMVVQEIFLSMKAY